MKSLFLKFLRSPRTISILFRDRILVSLWMWLIGVRFGQQCHFRGLPIVKLATGARIKLGDNVSINSRYDTNVCGLPHPMILAAVEPQSCIEIGDGSGMSGASIVAERSVTIGKRVLIGAGACIWDSDFHPLHPDQRRVHSTRGAKSRPITIADEVFIGARAIILKGVNIGRGAVIGAGAVVTNDVKTGDIVAGNPARVVGSIDLERKGSRCGNENLAWIEMNRTD